MNYLLDKKIKRKRIFYAVFFCIGLLVFVYFRAGIYNGLSGASQNLFRPVLVSGRNIGGKFSAISAFFASKNSLTQENENLKSQLNGNNATMLNYNSLLAENTAMKEILGRKQEKDTMILSAILGKTNQSPYGSLVIDVGATNSIKEGDIVFALGNVPIGRIATVYANSAKVILFTAAGEKTQAVVANVSMALEGRGGGNFELKIPRDFVLIKGDQALLPGIFPYILGTVATIVSDPRDAFVKALLVSPVNVNALRFVQVKHPS